MAKLIRNKHYLSNLQSLRQTQVVKKRVKRILSEKQYNIILNYAKKYYVDQLRKFTKDELRRRYNLDKSNLVRLINDLTEYETIVIGNITNNVVEIKAERLEYSIYDRLNDIRTKISNEQLIHGEQTKINEGFVYLLTNPSWNGWVKVGMTVDFEQRLSSYNIYDPYKRYSFIDIKWTSDRKSAEKHLHTVFEIHSTNINGEWFEIESDKALLLLQTSA
jgi:hypothetical protein